MKNIDLEYPDVCCAGVEEIYAVRLPWIEVGAKNICFPIGYVYSREVGKGLAS
jgi:hypothetical protein